MTTENENKKRKYEQENRSFNNEWEENFFFIDNNGKALCVICNSTVKNYKASNLRRHYETNHPQFSNQYPPNSKLRSDKLASLKSNLNKQQSVLMTCSNQANNVAEASFVIAWNIARAKRPLALDESTDITDLPQLAVFIRFVSPDFVVKEELLDLVALQESTRGVDIKNELDSIMKTFDVPLNKLVSIATDGAPAMLGKKIGLIGLLRDDSQIPQFIPIHCIIHREHLVTKYLKYPDVMKTVLHIVNYIRTNAKNHRQFKNFLEELKDEELPNDINFFCIVRWLSSYNVLNRFVDLFDPITAFLKEKEITYSELDDDEWLQDLMFLTDVMEHLQTLNLKLQGKDKIISDLSQCIFSFQTKLQLFQKDIKNKTFCHFPRIKKICSNIKQEKLNEYIKKLEEILTEFQNRFQDLKYFKSSLDFFLNPFEINIIQGEFSISNIIMTQKASGKLELIEMQEDQALQLKYKSTSITEFWKFVPESKYPELKKAACRIISIFGTTYLCESFYSTLKFVKSKHRSVLTNQHLKELLRSAVTNYSPNFKELSREVK
ncbi:general transcription factor II-I repeat domain-containing protein 2-like [Centruroides vittatus]|uniref:general transcription factor II-I repeat domain-containing protein 2-like n=1 Tax=Centruroides vittatus TaxID=120091 RepID=UPI00350F72DB